MSSKKQGNKSKKQKTNDDNVLDSPLNIQLFNKDVIAQYRDEHLQSEPYRHVVVKDLCEDSRMRLIHAEIRDNMKANFKETDLFKVFQTGDLAALDNDLINKMPNLMALRKSIYSPEFREMVSTITGLTDLTDRVDCSANAYANSCHLLCHDDVIGTRRVSYIIYLTDPDDAWEAEDGGAVELYPITEESVVDRGEENGGRQGVPTSVPTTTRLPLYNTMLFFAVQPGRSYHSVQEVFSKDKPRLSISGWYHGPDAPKGSDKASLQQIMTKGDDTRPFAPFAGAESVAAGDDEEQEVRLTKEDISYLKRYVNPMYLSDSTIEDINQQFCENSSLQLNDFLRTDLAMKVVRGFMRKDRDDKVGHGAPQLNYLLGTDGTGVTEGAAGWQLVGPPHKRRYLQYNSGEDLSQDAADDLVAPSSSSSSSSKKPKGLKQQKQKPVEEVEVGKLLDVIRQRLFRSAVFAKYLHKVTALRPTGYKDEVRRFRSGLDYTVAHYGILTKIPRLDATLCFVNSSKDLEKEVLGSNAVPYGSSVEEEREREEDEESDEGDYYENLWDSGDVGAFECFIEAEEDPENAEAAEVYRGGDHDKKEADEKEESLLSVSPGNNVLSLVMRDEGIMKFIKYVSANAPGSRWDITAEYEIDIAEGEEEDSESDSEEEDDEDNGEDNEA